MSSFSNNKQLRVEPSGVTPPSPSSTSATSTKASVDPAAAVPPPSTSNDLEIWHMLETVIIVQATHGQILVDMLDELRALRADLESFRQSPPSPPFDDELWFPFGNSSQKGGVHM